VEAEKQMSSERPRHDSLGIEMGQRVMKGTTH
jgi:hypothetical protein